jgi:hypothetical protein
MSIQDVDRYGRAVCRLSSDGIDAVPGPMLASRASLNPARSCRRVPRSHQGGQVAAEASRSILACVRLNAFLVERKHHANYRDP